MKVGFAGAGNMAAAMARGLGRRRRRPGGDAVLRPGRGARRGARRRGGGRDARQASPSWRGDSRRRGARGQAGGARRRRRGARAGQRPRCSRCSRATPIARLAEAFPGVPAAPVMPNQPVEVRRGVLCYAPPQGDARRAARRGCWRCSGCSGRTVELEERLIDAAMAIMSLLARLHRAGRRGARRRGARERASTRSSPRELVAGALAGTAELLRERDPATIRDAVASPGGAHRGRARRSSSGAVRGGVRERGATPRWSGCVR